MSASPFTAAAQHPEGERGFTLVEMLVALVIFALLAGAGVGLLRSSVDTQAAVKRKLADLAAIERLRLLLTSDLAQALDRPGRDASGAARSSFVGSAGELRLLRTGGAGADGGITLQTVGWRVAGNGIVRQAGPAIDGAAEGTPAALVGDTERAAFRYRAKSGEWHSGWAPAATERRMPTAVELVLQRRGEAELRIVLPLPPVSEAGHQGAAT